MSERVSGCVCLRFTSRASRSQPRLVGVGTEEVLEFPGPGLVPGCVLLPSLALPLLLSASWPTSVPRQASIFCQLLQIDSEMR